MRQVREVLRLKTAGVSGTTARCGPVDRSVDLAAACRRRVELAAAGRDDRHGAGGAALHRTWQQAGPSPARRSTPERGSQKYGLPMRPNEGPVDLTGRSGIRLSRG